MIKKGKKHKKRVLLHLIPVYKNEEAEKKNEEKERRRGGSLERIGGTLLRGPKAQPDDTCNHFLFYIYVFFLFYFFNYVLALFLGLRCSPGYEQCVRVFGL